MELTKNQKKGALKALDVVSYFKSAPENYKVVIFYRYYLHNAKAPDRSRKVLEAIWRNSADKFPLVQEARFSTTIHEDFYLLNIHVLTTDGLVRAYPILLLTFNDKIKSIL